MERGEVIIIFLREKNHTKNPAVPTYRIGERRSGGTVRDAPDSDAFGVDRTCGGDPTGEEDHPGEEHDAHHAEQEDEIHSEHPVKSHGETLVVMADYAGALVVVSKKRQHPPAREQPTAPALFRRDAHRLEAVLDGPERRLGFFVVDIFSASCALAFFATAATVAGRNDDATDDSRHKFIAGVGLGGSPAVVAVAGGTGAAAPERAPHAPMRTFGPRHCFDFIAGTDLRGQMDRKNDRGGERELH